MQEFLEFEDVNGKTNPRDVGYKGLIIADLHNSGFPVQQGFVISSQLFKEFVVLSGIREKLFMLLKKGNRDRIVELIMRKNVASVEEKITAKCAGIKELFMQSSCVFKDHKFVVNSKDAVEGVKKCWASVFANKYLPLLNSKNLFSAVVVQHGLDVKKSGYVYTKDPLNKKREMIVEVMKPKKYYFLIDSNYKSVHLNEFSELDSPLNTREKDTIGKLGKNIKKHYGYGAKVSWVLGNRFYITGLRELNEKDKDYFCSQVTSSELRSR